MRLSLLTLITAASALPLSAQWQPMPVPVLTDLFSVDALDAQNLAIGTTSNWLRSSNGGASWQVVPLNNESGVQLVGTTFYAMEYRSASTLFGTGLFFYQGNPFEVRRSVNGGTNWTTMFTSPGNGAFTNFESMAWWGTTNAVVCGDLGRVARTINGGDSWTMTNTGGTDLHDVAWINATTVVVVGNERILRSSDSGQTWTTVSTVSNNFYAVSFPTADIGFAAGAAGSVLFTNDGGLTWNPLAASLPGTVSFRDFWATSTSECFGLSDSRILHSTDGGLHWSYFPASPDMRQLCFESATNGFAVGFDGAAYRTGGSGVYHPFALIETGGTTACLDSVHTFMSSSDPSLMHSWFVNGELSGTGTSFSTTFTEPSQQDTVQLVVDNGTWTDTLTQVITVTAPLEIFLNATLQADTLCSGQSTVVQVMASQAGTSYRLRRGDVAIGNAQSGNGGTLAFNTGAITAFDTLNVLATRVVIGCGTITDTLFFPIALGNPVATLVIAPTSIAACVGDMTEITIANTQPEVSYQLRRNGIVLDPPQQGNGATLTFPIGPFSANATYTFFATHGNGCTATLQQAVPLVLQIPQLGWGPSSVNPELGAPVDMMNSSNVLGGTYEWIFGVEAIPSTSNDEEPEDVIFSTPGTYVVQLIGITPVGCRDTLEHVLHVIEPPAEEECGVTQITANGGNPGGNAVALMDDGSFYAWHKLETAHEMMSFSGAGDSLSADLPYSVDATSSMVLMKHDRHGVPQWWVNFWNDSYGATTSDLLADSEGNVYSAYFHDEFNDSLIIVDASGQRTGFDPVPVGAGSDAMVVTSFDAQGRLRWVHRTSAPYSNEFTCLKFLGPNGLLLVETDGMTLFNTAGDELWNVPLQYGYRDVGVGPDDHIRITERFSMVIREYDGQGTLLYTSPAYVSTPPVFGPPSITGVMSADDAAGNIYEVHNIQGQLILGTDTIYGAGTDLEDDPFCAILVRRGPAGEVIWTKRMRAFGRIVARGMELNAGRVHLLANFDGPAGTDLLIDGLDTLNVGSYNDIWLISFDLEGGSPHAEHVYTHDGSFISGYITPLNALSFSPDGQHMAYCIPYAAPLVAGTDTAYTYADFGTIQLPGVRNFGIVYGTASCLFPGLPLNDNAPQAYFVEPMGYCAGQAVPFADASLYDPVEWDWQFPGGTPATSTEAQPVITYAVPGTYTATLIATNVNGVSDPYSLDVSIDVCTGVSASDPSGFLVHPNPAQDRLFVHGPTSTTAVVCSDMEGRTVWQGVVSGSSVIDTSGWPAGSYVLQVGGCPRVRVMVMH